MSREKQGFSLHNIQKFFESNMSAITFAEANSPDIAEEFLQPAKTRNQAALLVSKVDHVHDRALQYAIDFCKSMQCNLSILVFHHPSAPKSASTSQPLKISLFNKRIINVEFNVFSATGPFPAEVVRFVQQNRQVISVILDNIALDQTSSEKKTPKQRKWWQDLDCPLVYVPDENHRCPLCLSNT